MWTAGIAPAQLASRLASRRGALTKARMIERAHVAPAESMVSPSEVTCTVLGSAMTRTLRPSVGAKTCASDNGVKESRSPPTVSTGIDAGSGAGIRATTGARCTGAGQSRQAR